MRRQETVSILKCVYRELQAVAPWYMNVTGPASTGIEGENQLNTR
jgi:hypothetical protein